MTDYVVVQRKDRIPIKRFMTIKSAGDYIARESKYSQWTVLAQEGTNITTGTPYRGLLPHETRELEKTLWPML